MDNSQQFLQLKQCFADILNATKSENVSKLVLYFQLHNALERVETLISHPSKEFEAVLMSFKQDIKRMMLEILKSSEQNKATSAKEVLPDVPRDQASDLECEKFKCVLDSKGFDELVGIASILQDIKTAVILPQMHPQLFSHCSRYNTFLFYGPPGCGKTKLVHAIAAESKSELFCITGGNIMSSYVGESERNILNIFKYLRKKTSRSILLIDEVDAFCRVRTDGEQDYCRRIKTEFMNQLTSAPDSTQLLIIAATNVPWDIDSAIVRRFQKQIYVPLPNQEQRSQILQHYGMEYEFSSLNCAPERFDFLLQLTDGYSISDLRRLMHAAADKPIEELHDVTLWLQLADNRFQPVLHPSDLNNGYLSIRECSLYDLPANSPIKRLANLEDLLNSLQQVRRTVPDSEIAKFDNYLKFKLP